jgi:hypothetical protein
LVFGIQSVLRENGWRKTLDLGPGSTIVVGQLIDDQDGDDVLQVMARLAKATKYRRYWIKNTGGGK